MNMCFRPALLCAALFLSIPVGASSAGPASAGPALSDPIPRKIQPGLAVAVADFVRLPRTEDSGSNMTNAAHARIQYLLPFGNSDDTLVINDTRGVIYLTDVNGAPPVTYLDLREQDVGFDDSQFSNEMGVAGVAFHPQYNIRGEPGFGKFYPAYSTPADAGKAGYLKGDAGSHESVIREWTATDPGARTFSGTSREIFRVGQFAPNHNIGTLAFNPAANIGSEDYGVLYVALGDGGAANDPRDYGQSLTSPLGAILRIKPLAEGGTEDRTYAIPADNPFVGRAAEGIAPEIWVYGLRHAQHFSFDSGGRVFINDIGQNQVEEVNIGSAGANYGWRLREGGFATGYAVADGIPGAVYPLVDQDDGFAYPVAQYDHDEGNAIGSGYYYEGSAIPALQGKYVFADIVRGRIFYIDAVQLAAGVYQEIKELRLSFAGRERALTDVASMDNSYADGSRVDLRLGRDASGELYLLTKADGWVRKLVPLSKH